jgi:predicted RND superfamily exporter protein
VTSPSTGVARGFEGALSKWELLEEGPRRLRIRIVFCLALLVFLGWGLKRLRLDADALNLLPTEVAAVEGLRIHQRHFSGSRELWIVVMSETPGLA